MRKALAFVLLAAVLALAGTRLLGQHELGVDSVDAPHTAAPTVAQPELDPDLSVPAAAINTLRVEVGPQPNKIAPPTPRIADRGVRVPDPGSEPGSIEVTVVSTAGEPVLGATVQVIGQHSRLSRGRPRGPTTNALGKARISSVPLGSLRVAAHLEDFSLGISDSVRLTATHPRAELQITLSVGGSVEGKLLTIYGEPATGTKLRIHLHALQGQARAAFSSIMKTVIAGDDGSFRFDHLTPGTHTLYARAEASNRKHVPNQRLELMVFEGQTTLAVFEDLRGSPVELSGLVLRDGVPVSDTMVNVNWGDRTRPNLDRNAKTDSEGRFEVTLSRGGDYKFQISERPNKGSVFQAATIPEVPAYDLVIGYMTGRISGRVLGSDRRPAAGVAIMAIGRPSGSNEVSTLVSTTSGDDGEYTFSQLLAATYRITAGRNELSSLRQARPSAPHTQPSPFLGGAQIAEVRLESGDDLTAPDLILPAAGMLVVAVTDRSGNPVSSASVQGVYVYKEVSRLGGSVSGQSDNEGLCQINGVRPGDLHVRAISERELSAWIPVTLVANATARAELVLDPGVMVTIEVEDGGEPVEQCVVLIKDAEGRLASSTILKNGSAILGPLSPGTYRVRASLLGQERKTEQAISVGGEPAQVVHLILQ